MKSFNKYIYVLTALLLGTLVSCVKEDVYVEGTPDLENCYGVYFPSQEALDEAWDFAPVVVTEDEGEGSEGTEGGEGSDTAAKAGDDEAGTGDSSEGDEGIPADPSPHKMTFTVKRLKSEGAINVPYTISPADVFTGTEIKFEDGQTETTFDVYFSNDASVGVTYECHETIEDPEYALTYSADYKPAMIAEAILIKWNRVYGPNGEEYGYWRDDFATAYFGYSTGYSDEVIFEERDDKPGYYRLTNIYTAKYVWKLFSGLLASYTTEDKLVEEEWCDPETPIYLDATNPEKVFFEGVMANFCVNTIGFASPVQKNFVLDPSEEVWGTFDAATGTFSFPKNGVWCCNVYSNGTFWVEGNTNGLFDLKYPGFSPIDYSVELEPNHTSGGEVGIDYKFGADVSMIKYAVYEGALTAAQAEAKADELAKAEDADVAYVPEGTLTVSGTETGMYTLVTANYCTNRVDEREPDEYVDFSYTTFSFLKNADDMPVALTAEFTATDKYASLGYTSENSLEIYLAGQNIEDVYVYVERGNLSAESKDDLVAYMESMIADEDDPLEPLDDEDLAAVNAEGYADLNADLVPGTAYTLLVYADNGYMKDLFVKTATTAGEYNIIYETFSSADVEFMPLNYFAGAYDYYAVDMLSDKGVREKIGEVNISMTEQGYVMIEGLMGPAAAQAGLESDAIAYAPALPYYGNPEKPDSDWSMAYLMSMPTMFQQTYDGYAHLELPLAVAYWGTSAAGKSLFNYVHDWDYASQETLMLAGLVYGADDTMGIAFVNSGMYAKLDNPDYTGFGLAAFNTNMEGSPLKVFSAYDCPLLLPKAPESASMLQSERKAKARKNVFKPAGVEVEREIKEAAHLTISVTGKEDAFNSQNVRMDIQPLEFTGRMKEFQAKF